MQVSIDEIRSGHKPAIARAITLVENERRQIWPLLKELFATSELASLVGVTGPPGCGKSTLVEKLVAGWLEEGERIGVIAIDPSSEFSGGALLGDRIRMDGISSEPEVFIRSMATRGYLGGLNPAIFDTVLILSAAGYDRIVIETVGVGQNEIDIVNLADTTLVVTMPEVGDEIQAFKAGLMEAGDIFVLNKADHPRVNRMELVLQQMLELNSSGEEQEFPRLLKTIATRGEGVDEVLEAVGDHRLKLEKSGDIARHRKQVMRRHILHLLEEKVREQLIDPLLQSEDFKQILDQVVKRKADPYSTAEDLLARLKSADQQREEVNLSHEN